ncbi:MAG TPA: hypothetical protein VLL98_03715 [Rickettsiales bacterium]|nr:hypothetical protein [Rickettsiales bacterium]
MRAGDLMLLAKIDDNNLVILITQKGSNKTTKLLNLFNLNDINEVKNFKNKDDNKDQPVIQKTNSIHSDTSNLKEYSLA